jgi:threonine dehydrogenase-like Zn-dependent dehydrogenase
MRATVLYKPGDVRFEERADPKILTPTDAVIRLSATCVCGSDLLPYRGAEEVTEPTPMGHEYCGIVEDVGSAVTSVKPGQFVIGSFFASDNTCPHCKAGYRRRVSTVSWSAARRPRGSAFPWQTGRSSRRPRSRQTISCPACWPHPMCSGPVGSQPTPPA